MAATTRPSGPVGAVGSSAGAEGCTTHGTPGASEVVPTAALAEVAGCCPGLRGYSRVSLQPLELGVEPVRVAGTLPWRPWWSGMDGQVVVVARERTRRRLGCHKGNEAGCPLNVGLFPVGPSKLPPSTVEPYGREFSPNTQSPQQVRVEPVLLV